MQSVRVRTLRIADERGDDRQSHGRGQRVNDRLRPATCAPWWPPPRWNSALEAVET
jgi:hypothetical protein